MDEMTQKDWIASSERRRKSTGQNLRSLTRGIEAFCRLLQNEGVHVEPFGDSSSLETFEKLDEQRQLGIITALNSYMGLLEAAALEKISLRDNKTLLWSALKSLSLRPPGDLLNHIEEEDVIEIYNRDHVQIFRNLRFFELCSYSVADILVNDWPSLYARDPAVTQVCFQQMLEILDRGGPIQRFTIQDHDLKEIFSAKKKVFNCSPKLRVPLFAGGERNKKPSAILATLGMKTLT